MKGRLAQAHEELDERAKDLTELKKSRERVLKDYKGLRQEFLESEQTVKTLKPYQSYFATLKRSLLAAKDRVVVGSMPDNQMVDVISNVVGSFVQQSNDIENYRKVIEEKNAELAENGEVVKTAKSEIDQLKLEQVNQLEFISL